MGRTHWDVPRTEHGLQDVLARLDECRAAGDHAEVGKGLLALSYLVNWVRSDTDKTPFERSHELALEALDVLRGTEDKPSLIRALIAASAMADRNTKETMLCEAQGLADACGDQDSIASVISARARMMALSNRERAAEMYLQALQIYLLTGNLRGQARCLFSLAISPGIDAAKRDHALEAARLYRTLDDPAEASRCMMVAFMNAEKLEPLCDLEAMARQGLKDALDGECRSQEGLFYGKLALIHAAKGQEEEAEMYRRWETDIKESDGLTPLERWEMHVEMTNMMIASAKANGNEEVARDFEAHLKQLKASKPQG